jgi:arsenate reductase
MKAPIVLYGIPNCDSVKRAAAWLAQRGLAHDFHDFKRQGVPAEGLAAWVHALGWQKLLNRQGSTWRKLEPAAQASAVDAPSAMALMLAQPSVIKRPVVDWGGGRFSVGFDPVAWAQGL